MSKTEPISVEPRRKSKRYADHVKVNFRCLHMTNKSLNTGWQTKVYRCEHCQDSFWTCSPTTALFGCLHLQILGLPTSVYKLLLS